jgi:hypothetical protein
MVNHYIFITQTFLSDMVTVQEADVGVAALVISILGYCICWIPTVGWLGFFMGVFASALGFASLVHWYYRPHYTAYGISAILIGGGTASLGLAYQVKHAGGELDFLVYSVPTPLAYYVISTIVVFLVLGTLLARLKSMLPGTVLAALALVVLIAVTGSALHTADRSLDPPSDTNNPVSSQVQNGINISK